MATSIEIRKVCAADGSNGLFDVLSQLTEAPPIAPDTLASMIRDMDNDPNQCTLVAVDSTGRVVATGALLVEQKLIRGGKRCGHIEDIVVDSHTRGQNLGRRIIDALVNIARGKGCYKVILDCADDNIPFYKKCGFEPKERQMAIYF